MNTKTLTTVATLAAGAVATTLSLAGPAAAAPAKAPGDTSLAEVLAADGNKFDQNSKDFDVLEKAVYAVLNANPDSAVGVLADGDTRVTAFLPTDGAFEKLAKLVSGEKPKNERDAYQTLASAVDVHTIEQVLLYHVVPGQTLNSTKVLAAAEERTDLETAQGSTVRVVLKKGDVVLQDGATEIADPKAIPSLLDINKGNKQIGHGINRVLLPGNA